MTKNSCRIHMLVQNVRYEKFTTVNMLTQQRFRPRTVSENRVIRHLCNLMTGNVINCAIYFTLPAKFNLEMAPVLNYKLVRA